MISFILLNYKNLKDTIECIESINKIKTDKKISTIVVDNASLTKDEVEKLKKYTKDIILLKENVGFAKGNNKGCKYAIEKYNPDFLCVINNDTLIKQANFVDEIYRCYKETNFDIMGPKIITDGGESVNPFPVYDNIDTINEKIAYHNKLIKIYGNVLLRNLLAIYMKTKRLFVKPKHLENGKKSEYGVALHGCALIFSKKYYKRYNDVFYNETFLYHEEEFLYYRKLHDNLITYYDANLEIFHKEGASLNKTFEKDNYKKLIFRNKEIVKSLTLLKNVYEKNETIWGEQNEWYKEKKC